MYKYFICFFLLVTSTALNCFAIEPEIESSIQKVTDQKVYLKPGNIQIANNGIFINVEGKLMCVDHLDLDNEGVYFEPNRISEQYTTARSPLEQCETCGIPLAWGKCVNPACPSKKKKK